MDNPTRVLVVGRSPRVLNAAVDLIRAKGHRADATNQFTDVLDDYDVSDLGVLVFGGMVPPDLKQQLHDRITERNPSVTFLQGLVGIPGVIAAQVSSLTGALDETEASYDATARTIRVDLAAAARTTVEFLWLTSWTPPEPSSTSITLIDENLPAGTHTIPVPDEVPAEASFATVTVGDRVRVLTLGPLPAAVTRMTPRSADDQRLPDVAAITTHTDS